MKTILVLAYAVSPTRGSEYAVGWNFARAISKSCRVILLVGASGEHMGDTVEIEDFFSNSVMPNIELVVVKPNFFARIINFLNVKGFFPAAFYIAFPFWQFSAYLKARSLLKDREVDLVHHLNPIGFREPGFLWLLNKPFVWGPIGGAQFIDVQLANDQSFRDRLSYRFKNLVNYITLKLSLRVRLACDRASSLIFATSTNKANFKRFLGKQGDVISEQAVYEDFSYGFSSDYLHYSVDTSVRRAFKLVWVGTFFPRKNVEFLLRVLSRIPDHLDFELTLVGEGPQLGKLIKFAADIGVDNKVNWVPRLPRYEIARLLSESDLHCITSLSEANTTVLYEAISVGLPTISLNCDGMADTLESGGGVLVEIGDYLSSIDRYSAEIIDLIQNPRRMSSLRESVSSIQRLYTWDSKAETLNRIYSEVLKMS